LGLWLLGVSAKGTTALEGGVGRRWDGLPVFKGPEPWQARQAEGVVGGTVTAGGGDGVRFSDGTRKRKRLTGGAASSATEGMGRAVSEPSRGRRKATWCLRNWAIYMLGRAEEIATRGRNER